MLRIFVWWFLITPLMAHIHPYLGLFAFVYGPYRQYQWFADSDPTRNSEGYKITGRSGGYNPLVYLDYSDRKPPKQDSFFF